MSALLLKKQLNISNYDDDISLAFLPVAAGFAASHPRDQRLSGSNGKYRLIA